MQADAFLLFSNRNLLDSAGPLLFLQQELAIRFAKTSLGE